MKLHHLFLVLITCCILSGFKNENIKTTITGQLEGVEDSTVITLYERQGRISKGFLSEKVINGKFLFILPDSLLGTTKELSIGVRGKGFPPTSLPLWASPGDLIKITGKDKLIRTWEVESNNPLQKELNVYIDRTREYERGSQTVMTQAYACFDSMRVAPDRRKEFRAQIDSLYAIRDSLSLLTQKIEMDILEEKKTYSDVWMDKLNQYSAQLRYKSVPEAQVEKLKSLYAGIPDEIKKTETGKSINLSLNLPKIVGVGDDMADMDMWDTEGNLHRLEQYKGKFILIDFWSRGCGPCMQSIPEMREISEEYKDKLTIVSISSDPKEIWERVSREKNITWVNLNDFKGDDGIKLYYGVKGIPNYFLISPEGKIISTWMGYGKGLLKMKMKDLL